MTNSLGLTENKKSKSIDNILVVSELQHALEVQNTDFIKYLEANQMVLSEKITGTLESAAKFSAEGIALGINAANDHYEYETGGFFGRLFINKEEEEEIEGEAAAIMLVAGVVILTAAAVATTVKITSDTVSSIKDSDNAVYDMYGGALSKIFKNKYAHDLRVLRSEGKEISKEMAINACLDREALKPMIKNQESVFSRTYGNIKDLFSGKSCEKLYENKGAEELLYSTFEYKHNEMYFKRYASNVLTETSGRKIYPEDVSTKFLQIFASQSVKNDIEYADENTLGSFYVQAKNLALSGGTTDDTNTHDEF